MRNPTLTVLLLASSALGVSAVDAGEPRDAQRRALASYAEDVQIALDEKGVPSYLMGRLSARVPADAREAAEAALERHGAAFRRGRDDGFTFRQEERDQLGMTHVRMTQTYKGLPVVGGELIVHLTTGDVAGVNGRFLAGIDLDTRVSISGGEAAAAAVSFVESQGGRSPSVSSIGGPVVLVRESGSSLAIPVLVSYTGRRGFEMDIVYVDGQSGFPLERRARVYRAKSRRIYDANQVCVSTGDELPGTLMFREGGSSSDAAAIGAYDGTGITYDYYKTIFNRDSYDNAGAGLVSSVHARFSDGFGCDESNAAWIDAPLDQMAYGDGDGITFGNLANGLDVTAHELTHGVCSRTANLDYERESGALNEATSDILGRAAAFWSGQGNPATRTDWTLGADVYTPGKPGDALRYMYDPAEDGYSKDHYSSRLYPGACNPSGANDECGVHGNSGIANLFFYLLSQGGTHPRDATAVNVAGVGLVTGEQIWYRALTVYMTSTTNFQGARAATAAAAADLYGGRCSETWQSVQKAWDAVGVLGTWSCGGADDSAGGALPESVHPYADGFDHTWTYTLPGAPSSISVTFDPETRVEANYDRIYVMDKNGVNIKGSPFTHKALAGATKTVPMDTVKIRLTSDSSVTHYGFKVTAVTAVTGGSNADTVPPMVSITAPEGGATVAAASIVATTATDNVGVIKVEFYLDGVLHAADTSAPYTWNWSPTAAQNGTRSLTAKAYDSAGNSKVSDAVVVTVDVSASCEPRQLVVNGGFESGEVGWVASNGVIGDMPGQAAHGGSSFAWMNGYGFSHTDTMYQEVTIPVCAATATLSFWLHIDTAEETASSEHDAMAVEVRSPMGSVLSTLTTYSNLDGNMGYVQKTLDVSAYKGQTIRIFFEGVEDSSRETSFVIDDVSLLVE